MLMVELFKALGVPMAVRNLMVDYCDKDGRFYHKPLQTVVPAGYVESDKELIEHIKAELRPQGFAVCGIQEVFGDFEMGQLESVFNGSGHGKYPTRVIFLDVKKAMG